MYELDFLAVGDGERSGDAICLRYTPQGTNVPLVGVIDAGFLVNGDQIVDYVESFYKTTKVDFVLSTHPDEDHINGMGGVVRNLDVGTLLIHRPAQHGYSNNTGAKPAEELTELAEKKGAAVIEPFTGVNGWGGSFLIAGPTVEFYEQMLEEQTETVKPSASKSLAARFGAPLLKAARLAVSAFPTERDFDDAGGTNSRNNSSAILSLMVDDRHLIFPGDAGVQALAEALDFLDSQGRTTRYPSVVVLPHHGSRRNLDLKMVDRIFGPHSDGTFGYAIASVSAESDNPSPRVANAVGRRGYPVLATKGTGFRLPWNAPARPGWDAAKEPLPPLAESDHD
jgi:beta-lactamase superfamily II metal-dependent hydrolase